MSLDRAPWRPTGAGSFAEPFVSVLVTARNNEAHIGAAIRSVLAQTFTNFELLVIDDGSLDATPELLRAIDDPRVRVRFYEASAGICARRNELVGLARARYVAPLDADDLWLPDRLERAVKVLERRSELVLVGSDTLAIDGVGAVGAYWRLPRFDAAIRWQCLFESPVIHSSSTIRSSAFAAGVRYDDAFPLAQDFDLCTRLLSHGDALNFGVPLALYRVHSGQASTSRAYEQRVEQERIGRREIEGRGCTSARLATLVWKLGAGQPVADDEVDDAVAAYCDLFARFEADHRSSPGIGEARRIAASALLRQALRSTGPSAMRLVRGALTIDRRVPVTAVSVALANRARVLHYRRVCRGDLDAGRRSVGAG